MVDRVWEIRPSYGVSTGREGFTTTEFVVNDDDDDHLHILVSY
jgi:hypothetical protein